VEEGKARMGEGGRDETSKIDTLFMTKMAKNG